MTLRSEYKSTCEVDKYKDEINLNIPITFNKCEFIKCLDILELDDIMNYLIENYHLIEIEKKLNEIKELDNE